MKLRRPRGLFEWSVAGGAIVLALALAFAWLRQDDLVRASLDPQQPFQTWTPPPAPNYAASAAWAQLPKDPNQWSAGEAPADVFFVHPTTFDGGRDWNAPIDHRSASRLNLRVMLPNYAGPFQRVGRVFAPRYRQASLYANLTNRDDAREARQFAYGDVRAAFAQFLKWSDDGRPIVVVGVEQGGSLVAHLLDEVIAVDPALKARVAAVYAIESVLPAPRYAPGSAFPACMQRKEAHCLVAWVSAGRDDAERVQRIRERAFVWSVTGRLIPLGQRDPLCVNPLLGAVSSALAPSRTNLGAANASGLEWGARPGFLPRQVSAQCDQGILRTSSPTSPSLVLPNAWSDRQKVTPYNLFYADLEADAKARVAASMGRSDFPTSAASINATVVVQDAPIHPAR